MAKGLSNCIVCARDLTELPGKKVYCSYDCRNKRTWISRRYSFEEKKDLQVISHLGICPYCNNFMESTIHEYKCHNCFVVFNSSVMRLKEDD